MKKILSVFLCAVMLMTALAAVAAPASAATGTKTIYVDTNDWPYGEIYAYAYYLDTAGNEVPYASNPGVKMTHYAGAIYQAEIPDTYTHVKFSEGSRLCLSMGTLPTDSKNLFVFTGNDDQVVWTEFQNGTVPGTNAGADIRVDANLNTSTAASVISVDVAWEAMTFTYKEGAKGDWDPADHSYKNVGTGAWSTNKPAITVTNHSNVAVNTTFTFTSAANGITGKFYTASGSDAPTFSSISNGTVYALFSAEGTTRENAPGKTVCFGISGNAIARNASLGTVTVTVSNAERHVTSETELASAAQFGGIITLDKGIDLDGGFAVCNDAELNMNDRRLVCRAQVSVAAHARCVIRNGELGTVNANLVNSGVLELDGVNIDSSNTLTNRGTAFLKDVYAWNMTFKMDGSEGTLPTLELSGTVYLGSDKIENTGGYTVLVREGYYNFNPMEVLSVYSGDETVTLTKDEANNTYTITENGVETTYVITQVWWYYGGWEVDIV